MKFWNWFFGDDATSSSFQADAAPTVACSGIDVTGNPSDASLSSQAGRRLTASDFGVDSFLGLDTD